MNITTLFSKSFPIIEKEAPILAKFLCGPLNGSIITLLEKVFGADDIDNHIVTDENAITKLKEIETSLQLAQINDIANARSKELSLAKITGKQDYFLILLAISITIAFFSSIAIILFTVMDKSDHDIAFTLLGILGGTFSQIVQYYYGASHRERDK